MDPDVAAAVPASSDDEGPEPTRPQLPTGATAADVRASTGPRYQRFVPKQARLREDQLGDLDRIARSLNRYRETRTERITSNTLIRVAIDALLARSGELEGDTEAQLRTSLGLPRKP